MTIDAQEYAELKKKVDDIKAKAERAKGALDQHMNVLAKQFDCQTIEDAEKLLVRLRKREQIAEAEYEKAMNQFKVQFGDKLC